MKAFFKLAVTTLLRIEAKAVLKRFKPSIVAVTGSVGKTSTKDTIFTVFSGSEKTRKSEKSFNSDVGVPLTILGLKNAWSNPFLWVINFFDGLFVALFSRSYPKWLVLEVGADRPGDIRSLTTWVKPNIAVLTLFPDTPAHIEFFSSPEEIVKEKLHLAEAVVEGGTIVANADDPRIMKGVAGKGRSVITYGFSDTSDVRAVSYEISYQEREGKKYPTGIFLQVRMQDESVFVTQQGSIGKQHVYPLLAALASAKAAGLNPRSAADALGRHRTPSGRMKLLQGVSDMVLIDDTYNASPVAVAEAVKTLQELALSGRKVAILGDMLELGKYSVAEHEKIGPLVAFVDVLITVGPRSRDIAQSAIRSGKDAQAVYSFGSAQEAISRIKELVTSGDTVLIKGSQGIRMEKIVSVLLADCEDASNALVRQDVGWKRR